MKEYQYIDLTYQDVAVCIQAYPTLKVRTKIHVNDQGHQELLLSIYGTIVTSMNHGVPIEIWVPKLYPVIPPVIYIRIPEANSQIMAIKPNNFVDVNGKFYNPFLSYWNGGADRQFNLNAVCFVLKDCFDKELPVFAKQETELVSAVSRENKESNIDRSVAGYVGVSPANSEQTPILPPKPTNIDKQLLAVQNNIPPLPQKPKGALLSGTVNAPPLVAQSIKEPEKTSSQIMDLMDSEEFNNLSSTSTSVSALKQQIIDKINYVIKNEFSDSKVESQLSKFLEIITQFQNVLQFEKQQLQIFENDIVVSESILKLKIHEIQQEIMKADAFEEPDILEIIIGETLVHSQLYILVAECKSLDDIMYCLSRLHDNGKISLDVFMKQIRSLAREQFQKKALIDKVYGTLKNKY